MNLIIRETSPFPGRKTRLGDLIFMKLKYSKAPRKEK
jgi:hypothetical protein